MRKCQEEIEDLSYILKILNGKWKLHILTALYYGKLRFKELEREISDVSAKVLAKELKDLETAGVVNRQVFTTVPVTVEYSLTQNGKSLKPVLEQMRIWSVQYKRFTPR